MVIKYFYEYHGLYEEKEKIIGKQPYFLCKMFSIMLSNSW